MLAAPLNFPVSAAGGDVLVTPFTGVEIENSALNVSAEKVQPLGNGLDGSKITIQADLDPIDNKNFVFPGHHNDRAKVITGQGGNRRFYRPGGLCGNAHRQQILLFCQHQFSA